MGYLRLMRHPGDMLYTADEQSTLFSLLASSAGVSDVRIDGRHPRGGYRVGCTISPERFDQAMMSLIANDWISLI